MQETLHGDAWTLSKLNMDTFLKKIMSFTHLQVDIFK